MGFIWTRFHVAIPSFLTQLEHLRVGNDHVLRLVSPRQRQRTASDAPTVNVRTTNAKTVLLVILTAASSAGWATPLIYAHVNINFLASFPRYHQILNVLQCLMISWEKSIMEKIIWPKSKTVASAAILFPVRQIHENNTH